MRLQNPNIKINFLFDIPSFKKVATQIKESTESISNIIYFENDKPILFEDGTIIQSENKHN